MLNRLDALNALNEPMIAGLQSALAQWQPDPDLAFVTIEGQGRAFCAGGDVRAVRQWLLEDDLPRAIGFFRDEYALNAAIAAFPRPYVALIDGACMGGGIGVAVHGSHIAVTERAVLAMPETAIALFPDVGTSHVLPRLPGALGLYLALTGARLHGADAVHAGLATHFVPSSRLGPLRDALAAGGPACLEQFADKLPPFTLAPHRDAIDRCFGAGTLDDVLLALQAENTSWAESTRAQLATMSPAALQWTFALQRFGARHDLTACLQAELALIGPVLRFPDFIEGVRAMLVDKDRAPRWATQPVQPRYDAGQGWTL